MARRNFFQSPSPVTISSMGENLADSGRLEAWVISLLAFGVVVLHSVIISACVTSG
jgi:hypothetical protein